jgi:hypothetical protein
MGYILKYLKLYISKSICVYLYFSIDGVKFSSLYHCTYIIVDVSGVQKSVGQFYDSIAILYH